MSGTNQSKITVTLRNPLDHTNLIEYYIIPNASQLAQDWVTALKKTLVNGNLLEKNFCFLGFPHTARTLEYLCNELTQATLTINNYFDDYQILEEFTVDTLRYGLDPNHDLLNHLHNHFERLQGTVDSLSNYYRRADYDTKYAIRQLNLICHEIESLLLSQRKLARDPDWVRPSQITTFLAAQRYDLTDEHRQGFLTNGYNRVFGGVYMHWTQIGKTLFEVWRDEGAPKLDATVCEAITHLKYFSGEFDIDWGRSCILGQYAWHDSDIAAFTAWLVENNLDPLDTNLSLGYLELGHVDLQASFGSTDPQTIWKQLGDHLDIYSIEVDGIVNKFDYCWTDADYKQQQIAMMRPGYDFSSRG
jgi:hypothetical protein